MNPHRVAFAIMISLAALTLTLSLPGSTAVSFPAIADVSSPTVTICFYRNLELVCVERPASLSLEQENKEAQARTLLQAMLSGPAQAERAQGLLSALPDGAQLEDVNISGDSATIKLDLPESFLYNSFDPLTSDRIVAQIGATLDPLNLRALDIQARDREGILRRLSHFLFEPPAIHKQEARDRRQEAGSYTEGGALAGKAVYVSAGHGWYWATDSSWRTQRIVYQGFVEDFNNAEVVNQYLIQYLRNAGADVWPVRERDMNTEQIIITRDSSGYSDQGEWTTSTKTGYNGLYRRAIISTTATATATWAFTPTTNGQYAVYAWYLHGSNRAPDAHYFIQHAGGVSEARIDQTVHGKTWRYIGTFPFAANVPARVSLTNQSTFTGEERVVIADAIRIGGGLGSTCGDTPGGCYAPSGRPRWEEAARYWAKYQGAPPDVYDPVQGSCDYGLTDLCDDITARPRYAEWEKPSGEDAVYISWHTNGYNGTARGTESYIYLTPTPGSTALQSFVHTTLIGDILAGWDLAWTDQGMKSRDLGEVRLLSTMPGVLLEIAYHDNVDDANALKDPRFGQLTARAVYKGIVKYFADKDGETAAFLPEPPKTLAMRNIAPGSVQLDWLPSPTDATGLLGDAANSYRVYTSTDGFGWSNGIDVSGTSYTLSNLPSGQLIFARVTGVNAGGESFPTPVVGARVGYPAYTVIVDGFGRIDRRGLVEQDDGSAVGVNKRMFLDRINSFDYVIEHGTAITLPFDSAHRYALGALPIALGDYKIVDWIAGEEQSQSDPIPPNAPEISLSASEQAALQNYIAGGGALFISGSELGYDLVHKGNGAAFYTNVLKATYVGDDADSYSVTPVADSIFDGLGSFNFDDSTQGTYNADWPDYFTPTGSATPALTYVGGQGAALQYDSGGCSRLVYLGFPFETIYDAQTRQDVMERAICFLGACIPPETSIQSPANLSYHTHAPHITGTASQAVNAPIASVYLQVISGTHYLSGTTWLTTPAWITASGAATWSYTPPLVLPDGWYTVTAQAWSYAGISDTTPASIAFAIDTISPTMPLPITPTGGITVSGVRTSFVFSPSYDTALAGYIIEIDARPFLMLPGNTFVSPIALRDGAHTWRVRAFDLAGNLSLPSDLKHFVTTAKHAYLPITLKGFTP